MKSTRILNAAWLTDFGGRATGGARYWAVLVASVPVADMRGRGRLSVM